MDYQSIIASLVSETKEGRSQKLAYWRIIGGLKQMYPQHSNNIEIEARKSFNQTNALVIEQDEQTQTVFLEADPDIERLLIMQTEKGGCAGCNPELQAAILEAEQAANASTAVKNSKPTAKNADNKKAQ